LPWCWLPRRTASSTPSSAPSGLHPWPFAAPRLSLFAACSISTEVQMHLEGEPLTSLLALPPGALEHLLDCARCRLRLRDVLDPEVVEPLGHGLPPSGLGEAILVQASRICAQRDREQTQEAAEGAALYE